MEETLRPYFELLGKWNRKINLTAADDEARFMAEHAEDARFLLSHLGDAKTLVDLGTGAGIPGILLKIWRPDIEVTLLDSTRKKISFCAEAVRFLKLSGIRAVWGRAESAAMQRALGVYDLVVSRATWRLKDFLPMALPYSKDSGRIFAMKGQRWESELSESAGVLRNGTLRLAGTHPYTLPNGKSRCLIVFDRGESQS
ncbi:MAG TPA: 16S rRNA (guanine(527)-N(7))-methyltransferase RsmG [bacterium]|nr:16S rRNA (guanine(527)-N(7))-methyltransferase RsmG [bacterium]